MVKTSDCRIILVVRATAPFGGMQRRYIRLASYLMKQFGAGSTHLLVERSSADYATQVANITDVAAVNTFEASARSGMLGKVWTFVKCIRAISRANCRSIFLASGPGPFTALIAFTFLWRARVSFCMVDYNIRPNANLFRRIIAAACCLLAYRIDCLSPELRNDIVCMTWGVGRHKIRVAPCSFTDYSQVKTAPRRDIDVLFMSRFIPEKGLDLISEIGQAFPQLNIHVCGFGAFEFNKHHFNVYQSDNPFEQMARSRIFLSLQRVNNYPSQSVLEAMASGCAIIATDVGETRLLLDDECAILIPYEASALKNAIKELMQNPEKMERLARNGKQRVMKEHTVKHYSGYFIREIVTGYE